MDGRLDERRTGTKEGKCTVKVIFVDVRQDVGALCSDLLVSAHDDHLESARVSGVGVGVGVSLW